MNIEHQAIIGLAVLAAVLVTGAILLYLNYYKIAINRQLHADTPRKRRLPSPGFFSFLVIITSFVILPLAFLLIIGSIDSNEPSGGYMKISYETRFFSMTDYNTIDGYKDEMDEVFALKGYDSIYAADVDYWVNEHGYQKEISQQGDVRFNYCFGSVRFDNERIAPVYDLFILTEYTGIENIEYYGVVARYYLPDGMLAADQGYVYIGADDSNEVYIIGDTGFEGTLELTVYFFGSDGYYDTWAPNNHNAAASETLVLTLGE